MREVVNLDDMAKAVESNCGINGAVPWFLMASVLYYRFDISILSDHYYDAMAGRLLEHFDELTHRHAHLLDKSSLSAGTMYHLKVTDYPLTCRAAAYTLIKDTNLDNLDEVNWWRLHCQHGLAYPARVRLSLTKEIDELAEKWAKEHPGESVSCAGPRPPRVRVSVGAPTGGALAALAGYDRSKIAMRRRPS